MSIKSWYRKLCLKEKFDAKETQFLVFVMGNWKHFMGNKK